MATTKLFAKPNAPYYLYAPPYEQRSGGTRAMHYLCHALNLLGEEAYVLTAKRSPKLRTPCLTEEISQIHVDAGREPIAIYPEVIPDNPLGARNVVRYLLNIPGLLTKEAPRWQPDDLIYTLAHGLVPAGTQAGLLELPLIDTTIYSPPPANAESRRGTLVFFNRYLGRGGQLLPLTEQSTEISFRVQYRSPEELAELYRHAELMYIYEDSTACYEAMLCGCPVVYLPNPTLLPERTNEYLGPFGSAWGASPEAIEHAKQTVHLAQENYALLEQKFWCQLASFVEDTQTKARHTATTPFHAAHPASLSAAISHYDRGEYEAATECLSGLLEIDPANPVAYAYLAFVCATQGLAEDAESFIAQARELAPGRHDLSAALGEVFLKHGQPEAALRHLQPAVIQQPDMFSAYPALAEALRLNGKMEAAVQLLFSGAKIASPAQSNICQVLIEMLESRGDIAMLAELCSSMREDTTVHAKGLAVLAAAGRSPEQIQTEFDWHVQHCLAPQASRRQQSRWQAAPLLTVAFLVCDFLPEIHSGRLEALLQHLPSARFRSIVLDAASDHKQEEAVQRCFLLCDQWTEIATVDDATAVSRIAGLNIDALIDLNGLVPGNRLGLLLASDCPFRASWDDLAASSIAEVWRISATTIPGVSATVSLSGAGEFFSLPATTPESRPQADFTEFGCLTPAGQIGPQSWQLFSRLLAEIPESRLTINLENLGPAAQEFITGHFSAAGIAGERLRFISATGKEALCAAWNQLDIGLAPLHGEGGMALPCALSMNRPYIAKQMQQAGSRRAAELLRAIGLDEFVASDEAGYLALARQFAARRPQIDIRQRAEFVALTDPRHFATAFGQALLTACSGSAQ